jgi:xanthine dehydrogenase iron-sulfur cluster and FAD-binding subunit A
MGELSGIDILILGLVAAVSVLAIYLRIRLRKKAKSGCGGNCGSCSMYCGKNSNGDKEA